MGTDSQNRDGLKAISVPVEITDTGAGGHRDRELGTGARLTHNAITIGPGLHADAECFIPASESAVATEGAPMRGHAAAGLNSMSVGRGVWLLTQKPLLAKLQAAVTALAFIIDRCGNGDTCVLNYRQAAEVCDVHAKSFQNWMNSLVAEGLITKAVKGREGVQVTLNTGKVGALNVWATAQDALARAEEQLAHMTAVQSALYRDSCSRIADARRTLA